MSLLFELEENIDGYFCYEETDKTIEKLVIPDEYNGLPVVRVGDWMCSEGFNRLENVIIGNNVTTVGQDSFNISSLKKIVFGKNVTTIMGSFDQTELTDVYYSGTPSQWNSVSFIGIGFAKIRNAKMHYGLLTDGGYIVSGGKTVAPMTQWECIYGRPEKENIVFKSGSFPQKPKSGDTVILPFGGSASVKDVEIVDKYIGSDYKNFRPTGEISTVLSPVGVTFPRTLDKISGYNVMRPAYDNYLSFLFCPAEFDDEENEYLIDKPYMKILEYNAAELNDIICFVGNSTTMFGNVYQQGWYRVNPETGAVSAVTDETSLPSFKGGYLIDVSLTDSTEFSEMTDSLKTILDKLVSVTLTKGVYCFDAEHWNGIDWDRTIWGV